MLKQSTLLCAATALLANCGATSIPEVPGIVTKAIGDEVFVIGQDVASTTVNGQNLNAGVWTPTHDYGVLKGFLAENGNRQGYFTESTSRDSAVIVIATNASADNVFSAGFARNAPTTLPKTGSVTYTGPYAAIYENDRIDPTLNDVITGVVNGDASITANFSTNEAQGEITNRVVRNSSSNDLITTDVADVTFALSSIASDGSFGGTTSGGQFPSTFATLSGEYQGLIAGANGGEAVGAVRIIHVVDPGVSNVTELGVFLAE
ncbi:MAG: hypothetical protein ACJA06_000192 [Halocynthiibacter sp.]|jgi:hypothetical protein